MVLDLQRDRGTGGTGATNHAAATAATTRRCRRLTDRRIRRLGRIGMGRLLFFGFVTTETVIVHTRHEYS